MIFPTAWLGFKLNEPAKVFTVVGWGSTSLYQMTMNLNSYNKLPAEVRKIIDEESEVWMDKSAEESSRRFDASLKKLKETGSTIQYLPFEERAKMAAALGDWPKQNAKKFDGQGLPRHRADEGVSRERRSRRHQAAAQIRPRLGRLTA